MADSWRRAGARWIDAFLPVACVVCARPIRATAPMRPPAFCGGCERALPWWRRADGCPRCGERNVSASGCARCVSAASALQASHVAFRYAGPIARWIPAIKRREGRPVASLSRAIDALADGLARRIAREARGRIDVVVPLPLHPERLRARGFNQTEGLARRVARELDRPYRTDLLERVRATRPQAALRGDARRENVRGAFRGPGPIAGNLRIALVDDVLTTGATLEAAASALLEAGAFEVRGVALAATLPASRPRGPHGTPGRRAGT